MGIRLLTENVTEMGIRLLTENVTQMRFVYSRKNVSDRSVNVVKHVSQ